MALSLKKQIERFLNRRFKDAMQEVADIIPAQIRKRTQLGKDLRGGKIKDIQDSTKAQRKRYQSNLDSNTTPNRSNLTATGQLLNAIECEVKGSAFEISLDDKRTKTLSGASPKSGNNEIRKHQEDQGRFFFGLLEFERLLIVRELLKRLKKK